MRSLIIGFVLLVSALAFPTPSLAQSEASHWGVVVNFTPEWTVNDKFGALFESEPNNLSGSEFQIGIARGRTLSGDWGLSLVKRKVASGSTIGERVQECDTGLPASSGCFVEGDVYEYNDVSLTGFEVHKYVPFVTIKKRAQVGISVSGGLGVYSGTTTQTSYSSRTVFTPPNTNRIVENPPVVTPGVEAKTLFVLERVPLGKFEVSAAAIVAPGVKVRFGYGLDFPGYPVFSFGAVYLFGGE